MKKKIKTLSILFNVFTLFIFFTLFELAFGEEEKKNKQSGILCQKNNSRVVRTVRVNILDSDRKREDRNCETIYTKNGKDETIGSGKYKETCYKFLQNIKENLEKGNWTCRDISQAKMAYL